MPCWAALLPALWFAAVLHADAIAGWIGAFGVVKQLRSRSRCIWLVLQRVMHLACRFVLL